MRHQARTFGEVCKIHVLNLFLAMPPPLALHIFDSGLRSMLHWEADRIVLVIEIGPTASQMRPALLYERVRDRQSVSQTLLAAACGRQWLWTANGAHVRECQTALERAAIPIILTALVQLLQLSKDVDGESGTKTVGHHT
jgi:hypothetical protein